MSNEQEEEVLGKAYDSRLMKRLLLYLRPYGKQVWTALFAIFMKSGLDILGPYLTKTAIDKYLVEGGKAQSSFLDPWLSHSAWTGIAQISSLYIAVLTFSFLFEFTETYLTQWAGQKAMFDLRTEIFKHLQELHIGFFDRNPVGRLVTRVTSDVDA